MLRPRVLCINPGAVPSLRKDLEALFLKAFDDVGQCRRGVAPTVHQHVAAGAGWRCHLVAFQDGVSDLSRRPSTPVIGVDIPVADLPAAFGETLD